MLFLVRILILGILCAGLGYAALFAFVTWVEPDKREIIITLPPPKPVP